MSALPTSIHSVAQVRAIDRYAIETLGIPGYTLMLRAAEAAFNSLRSEWPKVSQIVVVCGYGNNAGDGYVLARLALAARIQLTLIAVGEPAQLSGDARRAWQDFVATGGVTQHWEAGSLNAADVVIDAIFGTGLSRPLDATLQSYVQAINHCGRPIFSLDVPSGLDADSGAVLGAAIEAHRTISFGGLKQGFYLGEGPNYVGKLLFDDLDIPEDVARQVGCVAQRLDSQIVKDALPRRQRTTHKGQQGHVLMVGGGLGMPGAVRLAGEACLRVGAGTVTVATRAEHVAAFVAGRPELMCLGVASAAELAPLIANAHVIALGPGLGVDTWARTLFDAVLASDKPLIIDADALNLLAQQPIARGNWVLTPHPGEAARLLGSNTLAIQATRMQAANDLAQRYGGTIVLKGAGTLVWNAAQCPALCDRGNPGMAAPGMGDVLTGIIAGIAAQCGELSLAARVGVYVHAVAGDMAARHGERGLLASDLFAYLPTCVNP